MALVCSFALPPPDRSSTSSPAPNLPPPVFDLGFLVKCFFHSNCSCESALLHCPTFSPAFIFQGPSSVIFFFPLPSPPESQPCRDRCLPDRIFLPFYLLLGRPSFLAGFKAGLVLAPTADDSRERTLGIFPHQPSCTTFGEQHGYLSWTLFAHTFHPVLLVSILLAVIFFLWTFWLLAFPYNCISFPHLPN